LTIAADPVSVPGVPFLRRRRLKSVYRREFIRRFRLWEAQTGSLREGDLDTRVGIVRHMHEGAFGLAVHHAGGRAYGYYGDPAETAALERALLEPWAHRFVDMTAVEILAYETELDRRRRELGWRQIEKPPWRRT
jgi:hypothetical protein